MRQSPASFWHSPYIAHEDVSAVRSPQSARTRRLASAGSRRGLRSLQAGRQLRRVLAQVEQVVRRGRQRAVQRRRLQQPLQHAAGAAVLQALVRRERVLGAVSPVAELAHVQRVRLLVLVLEVSLQRVVAGECPAAVRTLLRLVYSAGCRRRHTEGRYSCKRKAICIARRRLGGEARTRSLIAVIYTAHE